MRLAKRSVAALRRSMNPDGFNLGFNLGKVAGPASTSTSTCTSSPAGRATPTSCRCWARPGSSPSNWRPPTTGSWPPASRPRKSRPQHRARQGKLKEAIMRRNLVKQRLQRGETVIGTMVQELRTPGHRPGAEAGGLRLLHDRHGARLLQPGNRRPTSSASVACWTCARWCGWPAQSTISSPARWTRARWAS